MRKIILFLFLAEGLFLTLKTHAQDKAKWPVTIALFTNTLSLPGHSNMFLFSIPLHPGLRLGTEYYWKMKPRHEWFQTMDLSCYVIPQLHYGLEVSTDVGYRYKTSHGFFYEGSIGVGYLHTFNYGPIFHLDAQGEYQKKTDWGRPHFAPQLGVGGGYNIHLKNDKTLAIFMKYQFQIEYPFTIPGNIPILPHCCFFIGTRFNIFNK